VRAGRRVRIHRPSHTTARRRSADSVGPRAPAGWQAVREINTSFFFEPLSFLFSCRAALTNLPGSGALSDQKLVHDARYRARSWIMCIHILCQHICINFDWLARLIGILVSV